LKVVAQAKVTAVRIYSAAYHPEVSKDLIFFGGLHRSHVLLACSHPFFEQINMANCLYGMHELPLKRLRMRTETSRLRLMQKMENTGNFNFIGHPLQLLPSLPSSSTQ
jgi:hypothetical protein